MARFEAIRIWRYPAKTKTGEYRSSQNHELSISAIRVELPTPSRGSGRSRSSRCCPAD